MYYSNIYNILELHTFVDMFLPLALVYVHQIYNNVFKFDNFPNDDTRE